VRTPVATRVVLVGRDGCHLCDDAREVVAAVCAALDVTWSEVALDDHPDLTAAYAEKIPVVLVDGAEHAYWRVDPGALRRALLTR
jgi:hypothetical protein